VVTLHRPVINKGVPEFTSVEVAPGRGMEILQITGNFPGKGSINVLASPGPAAAAKMIAQHDDPNGLMSLGIGAAFLIPYPNRVRGKLTADGQSITTEWQGHTLTLPVSPWGKPDAERTAVHGLIFKAKANDVQVKSIPDGEQVTGVIHAGDFGGHWLSKTDLEFTIRLTGDAVDIMVDAHNVGDVAEPMAIGWHPGFTLPSGDRTQVRVHIPGSGVAEVENYDNGFPTGKIKPVDGTQYDFRARGGVPLGRNFYDDNWSKLEWKRGHAIVQVIDPAANYGLNVEALSPAIKTIQMYAPPAVPMVAVEPQFNFVDPFGKEWGAMDTGTVTLEPGQSTTWHVRLGLFDPRSLIE
jgi:galactose mutarotase-like enzyme